MAVTGEEHYWDADDWALVDHVISVPLDHADPSSRCISVCAREVRAPGGEERPFLVFYQGGPGNEAPRPEKSSPGWLRKALSRYRVLLLDQRGTGRSTPLGPSTLAGMTVDEQVAYLKHFRADAIVADSELLRSALDVEAWSVLGQSFGGFCALRYVSAAPEGLREAFFTGGLPPLGGRIDEVYERTYRSVMDRSEAFYRRHPEDRRRGREIRGHLGRGDVLLGAGDVLTPERFRQLGIALGYAGGAHKLHHLLELDVDSPAFRVDVESPPLLGAFARNPIYAVLHESCWADGGRTSWSAARTLPPAYESDPDLLTGEHVYPWMFSTYAALRPYDAVARALAELEWPRLYDEERETMRCAASPPSTPTTCTCRRTCRWRRRGP